MKNIHTLLILLSVNILFAQNEVLDSTFNYTGKKTIAIGSLVDEARAIAIQSDGKILVAGHSSDGVATNVAIVRLLPDGRLDSTFSNDGFFIYNHYSTKNKSVTAIGIQNDGKILVSYNWEPTDTTTVGLVTRWTSDGLIDTTYGGGDGTILANLGGQFQENLNDILVTQSQKLLAATSFDTHMQGNLYDIAIGVFNTDGSKDTSATGYGFNYNAYELGIPNTGIVTNDIAYAIKAQSDGKILVGGTCETENVFAVIGYQENRKGGRFEKISGYNF